MSIKITKMQGCGNDFVILDYEEFQKMNCEMSEAANVWKWHEMFCKIRL